MSAQKTGHRAFPKIFPHPARARRFTADEFEAISKTKLQAAPSSCPGHESTTVWHAEAFGYIIEIRFTKHSPIYIQSICTFTPTMGMDRIDGELAQDAEEFILHEVLGFNTTRLNAFSPSTDIPAMEYLRSKGFIK
jgi:hypothetical protein